VPAALVLVADDEPMLVRLLERKLSKSGFRVISAPDGESALALIEEKKPDLVVLDAMMPGIDGFAVVRRLKQSEATRSIPIIMLTGRRQDEDVVAALKLGVHDFMSKPFVPEELVLRIRNILEGPSTT
jgi:DNA-binding response OmpR family regulator